MEVLQPVIRLTIEARSAADQEKLRTGLQTLMAEDPTFRVQTDEQTGQVTIAGMGELHLEIIVDRLKREFNVEASVGKPQVAYKETLTRPADGEMKPVLLEPVMRVEVTVPPDALNDIVGDLAGRRAEIQSQESRGGSRVIQARVPLSGMLGYATDLRSRTDGRASFTMRFDGYEPRTGGSDDDRTSFRGVPRVSPPTGRVFAAEVAEPEDDTPA